jgi:hypothetical protein
MNPRPITIVPTGQKGTFHGWTNTRDHNRVVAIIETPTGGIVYEEPIYIRFTDREQDGGIVWNTYDEAALDRQFHPDRGSKAPQDEPGEALNAFFAPTIRTE